MSILSGSPLSGGMTRKSPLRAPIADSVPSPTMDGLRAGLLYCWCAFVTWEIIWLVYPRHDLTRWFHDDLALVLGICSGLFVAAATSVLQLYLKQTPSRLLLLVVAVHFLVSITLTFVGPWRFNLATLIAGAADIPILLLLPHGRRVPSRRTFQKAILIGVVGTAAILFTWASLNPRIMQLSAWVASAGRPYCIQVEDRRNAFYRPAATWRDLNGLQMQASWGGGSSDFQFTFHAVLVVLVKPSQFEFYNWSYKGWHFSPISDDARRGLHVDAECQPVDDFFATITG
jgi:hypothetical protein